MNDQTQSTPLPTANSSDDPQAAQTPQKSPLDILEELLKDSKKGEGDAGASGTPATDAAPVAPAPAPGEMTPEQRSELEAKIAAQQAEDARVMQETLAQLSQVTTSPQYQARVEQKAQETEEKQHEDEEHDGHQIRQLGHTTI